MFWAGKLICTGQMSTMSGFSYYFPMETFTRKHVNFIVMKMTQFLPASEGTQFISESILEPYATLKIGNSKYVLGWEINLCLSNVNDVRIFTLLSNGDFHMQACEFHFYEDDSLYNSTWNQKLQFSDILASSSLQQ